MLCFPRTSLCGHATSFTSLLNGVVHTPRWKNSSTTVGYKDWLVTRSIYYTRSNSMTEARRPMNAATPSRLVPSSNKHSFSPDLRGEDFDRTIYVAHHEYVLSQSIAGTSTNEYCR